MLYGRCINEARRNCQAGLLKRELHRPCNVTRLDAKYLRGFKHPPSRPFFSPNVDVYLATYNAVERKHVKGHGEKIIRAICARNCQSVWTEVGDEHALETEMQKIPKLRDVNAIENKTLF